MTTNKLNISRILTLAVVLSMCLAMLLGISATSFGKSTIYNENTQNKLSAEKTATTTTPVPLGKYIKLGKYNGKDIVWRCVGEDDNGSLMLSDNIIDTLPYDAKTNDNNRSKSHSRKL